MPSPAPPHRRTQAVSFDNVAEYARSVIAEAGAVDNRSGARIHISLPGLSVNVVAFDETMAKAAAANFIQTQAAPAATPAGMKAYIVHPGVRGISHPLQWDDAQPYHPERIGEALRCSGLQASYFHDLGHWRIFDFSTGVAVQLMRDVGQYPAWEAGAPLRPFLHWHYARAGMRLAHCGTLGLGGKGVILGGAGGSGKSGTVIAGLLHGLQSVGDDYVLLDVAEDIVASPLFATLKQDPTGFRRLGLDRRLGDDLALNWQGKHQFRIDDVATVPVPEKLSIRALLLPRIGTGPRTKITPTSRTEALIALAASSIYQLPGERESGFRFFGEVTRKLPCFRLTLGPDPTEIVNTLGNFMEGITE